MDTQIENLIKELANSKAMVKKFKSEVDLQSNIIRSLEKGADEMRRKIKELETFSIK